VPVTFDELYGPTLLNLAFSPVRDGVWQRIRPSAASLPVEVTTPSITFTV
jgi:hypothetical protein